MKAFCFTLAILCAVQSALAIPRPDFGINGAVSGSATVKTASNELSVEATKTGAYSVTLTSGYATLTAVSDALLVIGDDLALAAGNLATQLNTLAGDGTGQIAAAFDAVNAKIDALTGVMTGTFNGNLGIVTTKTGPYIQNQLKDAFKSAGTTLATMKTNLQTLRTEVTNAKNSAGSGAVSSAVSKKNINASTVNSVIAQIRNLKTSVSLMTFVINSALDNLKMVDVFLFDLMGAVDASVTAYGVSYDAFKLNVNTEGTNVNTKLAAAIGSSVTSLLTNIQTSLDADTKYTSDLAASIGQLNTAVTTTVTSKQGDITAAFTTYANNVPTLITDLKASFGSALCSPIKSVSAVQIASHGYSDFCFSKYSPRVFALISLTIDAFDVCFEKELGRLIQFESVIQSIGEQIAYNTADLVDNLSACLSLPDPNKGACFTAIGPYYGVIATKAAANLATATGLAVAESKASYNRLGACLYASLSVTALSAADIKSQSDSCLTRGMALPRPDFGISVTVYGSAGVSTNAQGSGALFDKTNDNLDVALNSGFPLLTTIKTQLVGIANDFTTNGLALSSALKALADSTGPLTDAFAAFTSASDALTAFMNGGVSAYFTELNTKLDNSITTMLNDAFDDVKSELSTLGGLLTTLKGQLQSAVQAAGTSSPSKAVLRAHVSTSLTSAIAVSVISLKADIPLVTYIIANSIENLKIADDYIIAQGDVAIAALDLVNTGLEALEQEVQQYSDDTAQIKAVITPVYQTSMDLSSLVLTTIPLIASEVTEYQDTYTTDLDGIITEAKGFYSSYKTAILLVSDGLSAFYSNSACGHLYRLVNVLISNGKYADYCYNKYAPRTFSLFDRQARRANRCVDQEITRLLKLQEVLLGIAQQLVFNIEDILAQMTLCVKVPAQCNVPEIEAEYHAVHTKAKANMNTMKMIVSYETTAGLNRLSACFSTSKYELVLLTNSMTTEINSINDETVLRLVRASCPALSGKDALGEPRPDFGVNVAIAGSVQVKTAAGGAGTNFDNIDYKTISLKSHYARLGALKQALTKIGGDIALTGMQLTSKLEALAPSVGTMPQVYDDVTGAIATLRTLLETGLAAQKTAIEQLVGTYITDMLNDAADDLLGTLTRLSAQVALLQKGVNDAVAAYGTSLTATLIRRYVSPKVIYELLRALHDLKSDLPLVTYIIELTLGHLSTADVFITEFMTGVTDKVVETMMHYDGLKQEVVKSAWQVPEALIAPVRISYNKQIAYMAFIKDSLAAMGSYEPHLKPVLDAYETLLGSTNRLAIINNMAAIYSSYLRNVVTLDDYLDRFYDQKLCGPVKAVLQVLIASGPWADYCFSKYSPRLFGLVSVNSNRFLMCYQIEAERLSRLGELVDRLTVQIIYDIEDLGVHLSDCFYLLENGSKCIEGIGPYYKELVANLKLKIDDLLQLLTVQTNASYRRAAACVAGGKCGFVASAEAIVRDVKLCDEKGPKA
uniref:Secreted protein n=1 Tax=Anopheles dirus TaxID=7168 RepID=A0A182NUF7_9DIPT